MRLAAIIATTARAAIVAAVVSAAVVALAPGPAPAQPAPPAQAAAPRASDPTAGIDTVKEALRDIEGVYRASQDSEKALAELMGRLGPLRDDLHDRLEKLEPRLKEIEQRASEIPDAAAQGTPEDPSVTAERQRLTARKNEVAAALQQLKLLAGQGNTLDERIRHRRREVFSSQLFARSNVADPAFWNDLGKSVPQTFSGLADMASSWRASLRANASIGNAITAAVLVALLVTAASMLAQWRRRLSFGPTPRRIDKALAALARVVAGTLKIPGLITGLVLVLRGFSLATDAVQETGFALAVATLISGFGRGVATGLFAPGEGDRRIIGITDLEAHSCAGHLTWAARFTGLAYLASATLRILSGDSAPVAPFVATRALEAFALAAISAHLAWQSARLHAVDEADDGPAPRGWLRILLWLMSLAIAVSLIAGYVSFSVFLGTRLLGLFAAGGALVIVVTVIDAAVTDLLGGGTPGGRRVAAAFGLTSRGLDLITMLLSALARLVIVALAVVLGLNTMGVFADDIVSTLQRVVSDYDIGAVRVSPVGILTALACLIIGAAAVRAAQRWLSVKFLPRTGLEAGLQNSIVAL